LELPTKKQGIAMYLSAVTYASRGPIFGNEFVLLVDD